MVLDVVVERGFGVEVVLREDDGLAWFENGRMFINARWLTNHPLDI